MRKALGWIILASVLTAGSAASVLPWKRSSDSGNEDPRNVAFTDYSLETPALPQAWGRPLEGGAIRALFVVPRFTVGDVRALASRLDLEPEVVAFWDATHLGSPSDAAPVPHTSTEETLARFDELLAMDDDVIVWANVDAAQLPSDKLQSLFASVKAGAGLVLMHHRKTESAEFLTFLNDLKPTTDAALLTRGIGDALTPEWSSGLGFVQTSRYGDGRVVELDYPGPPPRYHCLVPAVTQGLDAAPEYFDTYLSLVARAVRWAAGHEPEARIVAVQAEPQAAPDALQVPVGLLDKEEELAAGLSRQHLVRPYWVRLWEAAQHEYIVRTRLRQPDRGMPLITLYDEDPLREGESSYRVYVVAGAGTYFLDVWLLDRDKVVDWFTQPVTVDTWPVVNALTTNKPAVLTQDTLGLSFRVPPRPQPFTVCARATDALGRLVSRTDSTVAANVGVAQVGLDLADLSPGMLKVEVFANARQVSALSDGDLPYSAYGYVYIPVVGSEESHQFFLETAMDGSAEYGARDAYRALAAHGIDHAYTDGTETAVQYLARAGLLPNSQLAAYVPERVTAGYVRVPCFNDPTWRQEEVKRLHAAVQAVLHVGSSTVSLGQGNCLATGQEPVCQSPATLEAFWAYLRDRYGSMRAVNKAWGTSFATWDNITPPPREAVAALHAYAPWVDFRLFMDTVFVDAHTTARNEIHSVDNRSRVGFDATALDGIYTGYDWPSLADRMDWLTLPVDERSAEQVRCFRGTQATTGLSIPSALREWNAARARWYPWYALLHGMNYLVLPNVLAESNAVPEAPLLGPDGAWIPQTPELFSAVSEIKAGMSPVLLGTKAENSGVALYVSRPSYYLNSIDASFGIDSAGAERGFANALRALGYSYDFVSSEQVQRGGLAAYRIVILPMARALADDEVAAIQTFYDAGGNVIADIAPGAFDEHGTARVTPPLAQLFGVRYTRPSKAGSSAGAVVQVDAAGARVSAEFNGVVPDTSVEPVETTVGGLAGGVPVWLVRRGKALSVLINHALPPQNSEVSAGAQFRTLLGAMLQDAGANRPAEVSGADGEAFHGEVFGFAWGDVHFIALLADPDGDSQRLDISFPDGEAVYDVRAGKRVARPRAHSLELAPGEAALFAVLPFEGKRLSIETLNEVVAGSRVPFTIHLEARKGTPSKCVVHVELQPVADLNSERAFAYTRDVIGEHGAGEGFVRLALNARPGVYKLVARDVMTGLSAETRVKVLSP